MSVISIQLSAEILASEISVLSVVENKRAVGEQENKF